MHCYGVGNSSFSHVTKSVDDLTLLNSTILPIVHGIFGKRKKYHCPIVPHFELCMKTK